MNDKNADTGELISALVDGELSAAELGAAVDLASQMPHGRAAWQSYHALGEALRGNPAAACADGGLFLQRLRDRLSQEAVAPSPDAASNPALLAAARNLPRDSANDAVVRWKFLAAAASLAAIATFGWHVASQQAPSAELASVPAQVPVVAPGTAPSSVAAPGAVAAAEPAPMLRDARLDALMAAHKQYGGTSALQMPAGFLRNATFDGSGR